MNLLNSAKIQNKEIIIANAARNVADWICKQGGACGR